MGAGCKARRDVQGDDKLAGPRARRPDLAALSLDAKTKRPKRASANFHRQGCGKGGGRQTPRAKSGTEPDAETMHAARPLPSSPPRTLGRSRSRPTPPANHHDIIALLRRERFAAVGDGDGRVARRDGDRVLAGSGYCN
jgi:hypothetical protein